MELTSGCDEEGDNKERSSRKLLTAGYFRPNVNLSMQGGDDGRTRCRAAVHQSDDRVDVEVGI